jgi:hypothetical protein
LKLTTLLVALFLVGAPQISLPGQASPTVPLTSDSEFQGATQLNLTPPDWRNPVLVIDALGVTFVERPGSLHRWIPSSDIETLEIILSELPTAAWPEGRTVFFDSPRRHFVADKAVRENSQRVIAVLARLRINFTIVTTGC